jgi:hypothetical protein
MAARGVALQLPKPFEAAVDRQEGSRALTMPAVQRPFDLMRCQGRK